MDLYEIILQVIDLRSFSNLWYWIGLAVLWSSTSHWVLGVPFDLITRARRQRGQVMADLEDVVRVNVNRYLYVGRAAGHWLIGFACLFLTSLALVGFYYHVEFAQAVFLLVAPMMLVGALSVRRASLIERLAPKGDDLCRALFVHRVQTQGIGVLAVFVTAIWGMYMNLYVGPFGSSF